MEWIFREVYNMECCIINNNKELKNICRYIKNNVAILAIDTEFIRQSTYFPKLCLIQIAYYDIDSNVPRIYLIDTTVSELDLKCFFAILNSKKIKKIIHSSSQDIEAFLGNKYYKKINNLDDTQLMAQFCGEEQISYNYAVTKYMNIINFKKDKEVRLSNWEKRPLSREQINYAKNDVLYLIDVYNVLYKKLSDENKIMFYENEMKHYLETQNISYFIDNSWKKLKFYVHKMDYNDLDLVKKIAKWREEKAIKNNILRNLIFDNNTLIRLIEEKPFTKKIFRNNCSQYKQLLSLPRGYKKEIIGIIKEHIDNIDDNKSKKIFYMYKKGFPLKNKYNKIETIVQSISKNLGINQEILLTQYDIIHLITKELSRRKILYGWKYALLNRYIYPQKSNN